MTPDEKQQRDQVVREAFECRHALQAYAFAALSDHALAEDVVQAAFIVVMDKYREFREGTSILAWCRAIVRLKVFEALRARKRLETTEDALLDESIAFAFEDQQTSDGAAVRHQRLNALQACLGEMPARSRTLLTLSVQAKRSYEQMGAIAGMSVEAVRKGLYRIRAALRDCVNKRLEAGL